MAGTIIVDRLESGTSNITIASPIVVSQSIYANTGNLLISANGTLGPVSVANTSIAGKIIQAQIGAGVAGTGPAFHVNRENTPQSFSSGVWTKIQFNHIVYDTANNYDIITNHRFTPTVAGYYIFILVVNFGASGGDPSTSGIGIYINGDVYRYGPVRYFSSGKLGSITATYGAIMNGTSDYVEPFIYSDGASPAITPDTAQAAFEGYMVRSA